MLKVPDEIEEEYAKIVEEIRNDRELKDQLVRRQRDRKLERNLPD